MRAVVAAVVAGLLLAACTKQSPDDINSCHRDYARRIGHPVSDDAFWDHLQSCARRNLLPEGANDPAFYE